MLTSLGLKDFGSENVRFAAFLTKPIKPAVLYTTLLGVFGTQEPVEKAAEKPAVDPAAEPLSFLRILMAEDIMVNQKVGLLLLERIGCRADVVSNGLEVIEALQRQEYDVILMDVLMPEMDGLQAARAVRDGAWQNSREYKDGAAQPYIIAMTANAMQGDREACIAAGMDDYISKPIQIEELALALSRAANIHKAEMAKSEALAEKNPAAVIEDEIFRKFQASLGDEDGSVIASLVQDFLTEGAQLVQDIHTDALNGNLERVWRGSHSLKSSSQMFGAHDLAETCKAIEFKARNGSLDGTGESIQKMDRDFEALRAALLNRLG